MVECKVVINDVKTGKSYQKAFQEGILNGQKIGNKVDGKILGLEGYELEVTGGSDSAGFAMLKTLDTPERKRVFFTTGPCAKIKRKGMKVRKTVRGNTISEFTSQVNLKVLKYGKKGVEELLDLKKEKVKEEVPKEEPKKETQEAPKEEKKAEAPKEKKEEIQKEKVKEKKEEVPKEEPKKEAEKEQKEKK